MFAADYGLVTLTMSIFSLLTGIASDHLGPTVAAVGTASLSISWAIFWGAWTWRLWR